MSEPRMWTWSFGQHWNKTPEARFQPGFVQVTQTDSGLLIEANLQDRAINLSRYPLNHLAFLECDAFEVFLGAENAAHYFEFHVTPSNSILQLRFEIGADREPLEEHMLQEPLFASEVKIESTSWHVRMQIPLHPLNFPDLSRLKLSFGRYDHLSDGSRPVISSTSPHTVCNFHRMEEWPLLNFEHSDPTDGGLF